MYADEYALVRSSVCRRVAMMQFCSRGEHCGARMKHCCKIPVMTGEVPRIHKYIKTFR